MTHSKKLTFAAIMVAAAAFPALAIADHGPDSRWTKIGDVGTHVHDDEDFVPVSNQRFDRLELQASGHPVPINGLKVQFVDGTSYQARARGMVRPGERFSIDLPARSAPIKMLVIDYGNRGPFWRDTETARIEVFGKSPRRDRRDQGYRADTTPPPAVPPPPVPPPVVQQPAPPRVVAPARPTPVRTAPVRYEWRAGVRVRIN